jgi:hypothetical protein
MRRVSLNARQAQDAVGSDEIEVALMYITHPLLEEPVRLSTDNTERLSDEPLMYGTRSTWMGSDPDTEPFLFVLVDTILPSDLDDAPASGNLIIENVDNDIAKTLRSFTDLATMHVAVVLASSPSLVELEYLDLKITNAEIDADTVRLDFSRENTDDEKYPSGRFTKDRFPGLHR